LDCLLCHLPDGLQFRIFARFGGKCKNQKVKASVAGVARKSNLGKKHNNYLAVVQYTWFVMTRHEVPSTGDAYESSPIIMYEPTWDWLATRIDTCLLPIARGLIEQQVKIAIRANWAPNTETDCLKGFCQHFDTDLDDINPTQEDRDSAFFSIVYDHIFATDLLKAMAMVETGTWEEIPEIYQNPRDLQNLIDYKIVVDGKIANLIFQRWALIHGKFVWGDGPYDADRDPFVKSGERR
jgi:hypothetical protein